MYKGWMSSLLFLFNDNDMIILERDVGSSTRAPVADPATVLSNALYCKRFLSLEFTAKMAKMETL